MNLPKLIIPLLLGCVGLQAPSNFDETIQEFIKQTNHRGVSEADRASLVEATAAKIDFDHLDRKQLYNLCMYGFARSESVRPKIEGRLDTLPASDPVEHAKIAYTRVLAESSGPKGPLALQAALHEPGTKELLNSPDSFMVLYTTFASLRSDKPHMAANLDRLMNWLKQTDHLDSWDHGVLSMYYDWAKTDLPNETKLLSKIRSVCGALDHRTLKAGKLSDVDRPRVQMDYEAFTGPALNGNLIGHRTPEILFRWCSDPSVKKLSDYFPGKVVVLDFWTTWCGPCVAAFPHIRDLVAHYDGKPVVFVGITSIQGIDYDPDGKIDCKGDPEKEMGLMPSFMKKKSMTWTVAFSTKDAFDPAFGVHDIPHMAIIDRKGVVRYNELRPSVSDEEFEKMVDPLLTN